jgi:iron complex transport system substrate-binding protein
MRTITRTGVVLLAVGLVLAACGDDDTSDAKASETSTTTASAEDASFPVTVTAANGPVDIAEQPAAIVSLSPTATEMLFAIGAGDQVKAVDDNSNFPDGVPTTDLSSFEPNVEAIATYSPDLVVAATDPGELVSGLNALHIPVLLLPAANALDDTYGQIEQLGAATGHVGDAAELVGQMKSDIDDITASLPAEAEPASFYHELDNTFFSATSSTFIGTIYGLAGLRNIADDADDGSGYPQLSAEYIIQQDPDLVFLADTKCCGQDASTVAARPGWDQLSAVKGENVVELDDDIVSRWGPRIVDFLRTVADRVKHLQPA